MARQQPEVDDAEEHKVTCSVCGTINEDSIMQNAEALAEQHESMRGDRHNVEVFFALNDDGNPDSPGVSEDEQRARNSIDVLGHPHNDYDGLRDGLHAREGIHYEVLAYTERGGYFVPSIIAWNHVEGEESVDDFHDKSFSMAMRDGAHQEFGSETVEVEA